MRPTVLITGFGRFPGAPFNPSRPLALALARRRRPVLAEIRRIAHIFPTSYAAIERDLPLLIARHKPDVVLMFGLATRTRHLRIECEARNAVALVIPDAVGFVPQCNAIAAGGPARLRTNAPFMRLTTAARSAWPARLSRDAGRYVCNHAYWQALMQAPKRAFVQFVHIPPLPRAPRPQARVKHRAPKPADLVKAGEAILIALLAAARR